MHTSIFLTGPPGVGKSTVVQRVLELAITKSSLPPHSEHLQNTQYQGVHGFYTEEVRQNGERAGFDVVTLSGQRAILARTHLQAKVGDLSPPSQPTPCMLQMIVSADCT